MQQPSASRCSRRPSGSRMQATEQATSSTLSSLLPSLPKPRTWFRLVTRLPGDVLSHQTCFFLTMISTGMLSKGIDTRPTNCCTQRLVLEEALQRSGQCMVVTIYAALRQRLQEYFKQSNLQVPVLTTRQDRLRTQRGAEPYMLLLAPTHKETGMDVRDQYIPRLIAPQSLDIF